jgi:hypothetical protein
MDTTESAGTGRPSSDRRAFFADDISTQVGGTTEPEPNDTDDVWPLEMWLSREEALSEAETWHVGRARGAGSQASRLRTLVAAWSRVPAGSRRRRGDSHRLGDTSLMS